MKLLIFIVLVSSHLLVDAKYVPSKVKKDNLCNESIEDTDCRAKIVAIEQASGNLVVNFVKNSCGGTEEIKYKLSNEDEFNTDGLVVAGEAAIIMGLENTCQDIDIKITTTTSASIDEICTYKHSTVLPAVTSVGWEPLDSDHISITWTEPEIDEDDGCELKYKIESDDTVALDCSSPVDCKLDVSSVQFCKSIDISVTPFLDQNTPNEASSGQTTYIRPLPMVTEVDAVLNAESNGQIITSFKALDESDLSECGDVHYQVEQVDEKCFTSQISVQVVGVIDATTTLITPSVAKPINRGPGSVFNLAYELIGNQVNVTWGTPADDEECSLWFEVTYVTGQDDDGNDAITVATTHSTYVPLPNKATACTRKDITVHASNGVVGPGKTIQVEGAFGGVDNIQCTYDHENTKVTCHWEAPVNIDNCRVKYAIQYGDGENVETIDPISDSAYSFPVVDCKGFVWIKVTPITEFETEEEQPKDREGTSMEKIVETTGCTKKSSKNWWNSF